ncbi:hypothetical protein PHYC_03154 [Phycisphaerales bacterium]|nr:hypothetical protein PHYC_03154 [Phycisphaerales bacterium]
MRIPASKVYRAFPELDKFGDAQCESFVKAAAGRSERRAMRVVLQLLVAVAAFFGVGALFVAIGRRWEASDEVLWRRNDFYMTWAAITMLATFLATGTCWLFAKDTLLRRAIKRVMQERGSCAACGYGLTGLPVNDSGQVICPECGGSFEADASMGEILADESGEKRFMPSPDAAPHVRRVLTPQQRKRLIWWLLGAPGGLVLLLAMLCGGYELFLWRQAASAKADRVKASQLEEFAKESQTGLAQGVNGWAVLSESIQIMGKIESEERIAAGDDVPTGGAWTMEFDLVYGDAPIGAGLPPQEVKRNRDFAMRLIGAWRHAGVFKSLDEIAGCPVAFRSITQTGDLPLQFGLYDDWWKKRRLATVNAARMKLATDAGDHAEFLAAFETNLAMSRMVASQASLWNRMSSGQFDALTLERVQAHAAAHPGGPWAGPALEAIKRQEIRVPGWRAYEAERLVMRDCLAYVFSEPSRVRFGMWSLQTGFLGGGVAPGAHRLGTYTQNRAEVESRIGAYLTAARSEPFERSAVPAWTPEKYFLTGMLTTMIPGSLSGIDRQSAQRRGMMLLAAVESYRADHARYPASLEELVPSYLGTMPIDPWTGKAFRFAFSSDGTDYSLYSLGEDAVDDGGASDTQSGVPVNAWMVGGSVPQGPGDVVIHAAGSVEATEPKWLPHQDH